ncbi:MAG: hypothetical protein IPI78_02205 [Chitinophagaceae bacterium]|nr:hypothetical protein [Chitinophagaceae bacterium]
MKYILFFLFGATVSTAVKSQNTGPAEQLSEKIAAKMKDSLLLTSQQKDSIYSMNMQLTNRKLIVRQQYTGSDSLQYYIQQVERSRDSLYRTILTEEKYLLYKTKKRYLVNNN